MDLTFTDDEAEYQAQVRRFADRVLRPITQQFDFSHVLSHEDIVAIRKQIEPHEIATSPPTMEDGSHDPVLLCVFIEEVARVNIAFGSLASAFFFQTWSMIELLDDAQRERYGYMFEPGEMVAFGLSEPDSGSNPSQLQTTARPTDGGWLINGRKLWTSHAAIAAGTMVWAQVIDGDERRVVSFLVERDTPGMELREVDLLGMNAISTGEVVFTDCFVPSDTEIRQGAGGVRSALGLVEQGRMKLVFMAIALSQASLDLATEYSKLRVQFGRPIGGFQLVQHMLVEMATLTETSRLLGYRAASLAKHGQPSRAAVSMAKAYATESAVRATSLGIQVHGGIGLTKECAAERYFRDARMLTIPDGTTQVHTLVVGRELTGISAFK